MLEKGLLGIERSLFDGRACHMIGDPPAAAALRTQAALWCWWKAPQYRCAFGSPNDLAVWPSFAKSIAVDAVESQVIDKSDCATVAVTDVNTAEIFGLVVIDP